MSIPVFSTQYFGSIWYYFEMCKYQQIQIESKEYFIKQTFRNRTIILTANGQMKLIVPLVHQSNKEIIEHKEICYKEKWYKKHYTAIVSAYKNSAYFEYYYDDLVSWLIKQEFKTLFEMNNFILKNVMKVLDLNIKVDYTTEYKMDVEKDYRNFFDDETINLPVALKKPYLQVFSDRFEFQENLSVLDLIFNLGPLAKEYLKGEYIL
jgi:hypothetical protein